MGNFVIKTVVITILLFLATGYSMKSVAQEQNDVVIKAEYPIW